MDMPKWEVELYENRTGRCSTREFLDSLQERDQVLVLNGLERLAAYGHDLRRPHVDFLRDDIYELRVQTAGGSLRFFYFFFHGHRIIVTHALKKKTSRVPPSEIDRAIACRDDYIARNPAR